MERKKIGEVFHFFGKIGVAAIRLTDGSVAVGDTVQIQGPTTNLEQTVEELQIEHATVSNARQGQEVGMKVRDRVREKDFVFTVVPSALPSAPTAPAPKAARALPRKSRSAPVKKATRAPRKTARRGSRGSRPRSR